LIASQTAKTPESRWKLLFELVAVTARKAEKTADKKPRQHKAQQLT